MSKVCTQCKKTVTRKSPGLECSKCRVLVHAKAECAGLSAKQFAALKAADNLEWTCNSCARDPKRRTSFVLAEEEEDGHESDNASEIVALNTSKFMKDVTKEIHKIIKNELGDLNSAMEFVSEKVEECIKNMKTFEEQIKILEKKNIDLINKNKNFENRLSALEQRLNEREQLSCNNTVEIVGVPVKENEKVEDVVATIANKIQACPRQVKKATRLPGRNGKEGIIQVELEDNQARLQWIASARQRPIVAGDISTDIDKQKSTNRIYLREALTYYYKNLLWKTKDELKNIYKYIWCKNGKILVRKSDNTKVYTIRCEMDIYNVKNM